MRFNKLDLNLLVALDALLTERNITRAAERMHLSQSAMSNALGRLRTHFDDELLVQVGRRMEPTPRADTLQEAVRDVLLRIDTTISAQPDFDPATSDREFTLFVSDYSMQVLIPHALALLSRQRGTVRIKLLPQVAHPFRALERGEADLLIIPAAYVSSEHPSNTLFREDFVCTVWRDSQLARGELTPERYLGAGHVVMQPPETSQPAFEDWFVQRHGISRRNQVSTFSFSSMPFLVIGTELIATVHLRLARLVQAALPITLKPVPLPMPVLEQTMQWHKYRTRDPGLLWLRTLMQQAAVAMDAPPASGPAL
jgi:LysR family transcriptional regulator, nod-box dependent transcriptional activator